MASGVIFFIGSEFFDIYSRTTVLGILILLGYFTIDLVLSRVKVNDTVDLIFQHQILKFLSIVIIIFFCVVSLPKAFYQNDFIYYFC